MSVARVADDPAPRSRLRHAGSPEAEELLHIEYELALRLGTVTELPDALAAILDAAVQVRGIDSGGIYLFEPEGGDLVLHAHRGLGEGFLAGVGRYPRQHPHMEIVLGGTPIFTSYADLEASPVLLAEGLRALAVIPVQHDGQTLAVLNAASHTVDDLAPIARTALISIASRIGGALGRVQAAEATRLAEQGFQTLFDSLRDFLFVLDDQGRIVHANSVAVARLGYTVEELLGRPVTDVHPPDEREEALRIVGEMLAGRTAYCPLSLLTRTGEHIPVETVVSRGRFRGREAIIGVSRDITARRAAEEALRKLNAELEHRVAERTAELTLASRAKDDFLASMSHELRTPLNAVLGITEALQEEVYGRLNDRQTQALGRVEEAGRHLLGLITDILELSKIDAGTMTLDIAPVVVDDVCHAALRLVQEAAARKRHTFKVRTETTLPSIEADARRLKQILVNLLGNAVKFTPPGGNIALEAEGDAASETVRISVQDTGVGIASDDVPRLFQRFVQLDPSLSRQHGGAGLGLALVDRFARLHGGRVEVESEPGVGSRFTVVLPRRQPARR